ncbi:MAG: hypothetical protein WED07_13315 [Candidatus Freyarchaeum deiterrae]
MPALQAIIVLPVEIALVAALIIGWRFGARRLNLRLHHGIVYSVIATQVAIIILWMAPSALTYLSSFSYPNENLFIIVHAIVGLVTVGLGVTLITIFLLRPKAPLQLIRRARLVMITTLAIFIIVAAIGAILFYYFQLGGVFYL